MKEIEAKVAALLALYRILTSHNAMSIRIAIYDEERGGPPGGKYIALVATPNGDMCGDYKATMVDALTNLECKVIEMAEKECAGARRIEVALRALKGAR